MEYYWRRFVSMHGLVDGLSDMDISLESLFRPLCDTKIMIINFWTKNIVLLRRNKSRGYKSFEFIFSINFIIISLIITLFSTINKPQTNWFLTIYTANKKLPQCRDKSVSIWGSTNTYKEIYTTKGEYLFHEKLSFYSRHSNSFGKILLEEKEKS